ncbi:hypothetical protein CEXT_627771 [Caerostris extrusa]|uniref:Uncharacterized protein n=1 Tax=Caerostris extrusa TaxID=172846 RepID=A0AAV4M8A9_CAEEX|nr:hypothetical protein CEXT_627771 [Caerostris extrusa]
MLDYRYFTRIFGLSGLSDPVICRGIHLHLNYNHTVKLKCDINCPWHLCENIHSCLSYAWLCETLKSSF